MVLDLAYAPPGGAEVANRYVLSGTQDLAPLLGLPPAHVEASAAEDGTLLLRHVAGAAALGLTLEDGRPPAEPGWAVFTDNVFDIMPGEEVTVGVAWAGAPPTGRVLRLGGWNVAEQEMPLGLEVPA
jgi:hypothetical protein